MDTVTIIVGGFLLLLLAGFIFRLAYIIAINLINGRKFHHALEQQFDSLRLNRMLSALGIKKKAYIYQSRVSDIHKQMDNCTNCSNTAECDASLAKAEIDINGIAFCNNEAELIEIKRKQSQMDQGSPD